MKRILLIFTLIFCISFLLLFFTKEINGARLEPNFIYATIEIQPGDNLWELSNEYNDKKYYTDDEYISIIEDINNINANKIISGSKLLIPIIIE